MDAVTSFILSIFASLIAAYIYEWLNKHDKDNR